MPAGAAVGRVVTESLALYAPGIPNVLPGERLTAPVLALLQRALRRGAVVRGAGDPTPRTVDVVAREPRGG